MFCLLFINLCLFINVFSVYKHTWSELLVPLVNMIKEGCEYKSALLILFIFYFIFITKI